MADLVLTFDTHPGRSLTLALFKDCINSRDIRAAITDASVPECAYINASLVVDPFAVQLAAHRALAAESSGRLLSKSLHTELIYGLSGTKHVGESLKRFGLQDTPGTTGTSTTSSGVSLLVAAFDCQPEQMEALKSRIQGTQVPLSELGTLSDNQLIDQSYKITKAELQGRSRVEVVAFRIGAKDCL